MERVQNVAAQKQQKLAADKNMTAEMHNFRLKIITVKLTSHVDTRPGTQLSHRKHSKNAAVAALIIVLHLLDGDGAAVLVRGGEVHAGVLSADGHGAALQVRQQELAARVEPAHLTEDVAFSQCDAAAEQQREIYLYGEPGPCRDCTCARRPQHTQADEPHR